MGRRPPLRGGEPPGAQHREHRRGGAREQPAGGAQLRGTDTPLLTAEASGLSAL